MNRVYLLDSDVFILSHRIHHPFKYQVFHPFWNWLEKMAKSGKIRMLDSVYDELTRPIGNSEPDELAQWVTVIFEKDRVKHNNEEILAAYAQVQDYLMQSGCYRPSSYHQWEPEDKADPWLIAAAKVLHATIVTEEESAHPSPNQPMKKEPKIPDVADAMGVLTITLREFYDASDELKKAAYPLNQRLF